ncbi:efflux RND transporter permease subunit [Hujiaoplasma nucleasis]|uniref:Efflux RND transporter permease subunit n=1 Tax=Hujiaoplasma nucleasis TaxID=2725268 RepID=A0A7L6N7H2_9MOLU|nr:efflux RND transporter permease subunit [Hujiaoplasma nucleasis]QLY40925.1 efflux RND transporter permease subunit [Hujiaoplasma nucleasis]
MSKYSVRKPITVLMGILIIIVLGIYSVTKLPLSLFPDINLPFIVTVTTYPGENPETIEKEVTQKIESSVATIGNFTEIQSTSYENFSLSIITFAEQTNMDTVVIEMRENINNIEFAEGVGNTRILRISPDMLPVMTITLSQTYDEELTDEQILIRNTQWINNEVLSKLNSIEGIADVTLTGASDTVLQINLDQDKLTTYQLDQTSVLNIIEEQSTSGLVGVALDNGELRMVILGNQPETLEDMHNLPITFDGSNVITLDDLIVEDGIGYVDASEDSYSKINGKQGIQISFQKQSDIGITEATKNIYNTLDDLEEEYPNASYMVLLDQGEYINQSINSVLLNIVIGALLAILILFVFLRNIKPTIIVGLAIPISVIAAFMLMYFTGVSLNLVSMGGLALAIGMLVDNAVVVIENIYRMINEGKSKKEAAIEGAKEVAGAITASTLTTVAVFLPIVFVEGLISDVFMSMALTIAYSLGASLIISLTLVPAMSSRFLDDQHIKEDGKVINKVKTWYENSVLFAIKHKIMTIVVILLLLFASFALVFSKGFILLPESDEGVININIETKASTEFSGKAELADYITDALLEVDDVDNVSGSIGGNAGMMMFAAANDDIQLTVNLKDNKKNSTLENEEKILTLIENINYSNFSNIQLSDILEYEVSSQNSTMSLGGASGVNIKVSGYDLLTLEEIANDLVNILENVDHITEVDNGVEQGSDQIKMTVNKDIAMTYNLTNQDVLDNLNYFYANLEGLSGGQSITVQIEGINYEISIPNEAVGSISFEMFGDYQTFLSGVVLFDQETQMMIDQYLDNNDVSMTQGNSIYILNMALPTYQVGQDIKFVINPFLKVNDQNEIIFAPFDSTSDLLASYALAPLYSESNSVTSIEKVTGFSAINTDGNQRYLTVTAQIEQGFNVTLVSQEVTDAVENYMDNEFKTYGSGYSISFQGENEEIMDAIGDLALAALVAILLVYMIMAIQFQSLKYPFIILMTIPLAFTGGFIALWIFGMNLSMVSLMGLIILIGVVVNNGIVLIDYINKLMERGYQVIDAIVLAGKTRLRPIFMTALTTILALVFTAIGVGEGAELLQPMALTAIGGLIYATVLTLIVVPTVFAIFNRKQIRIEGLENVDNQG